MLIIREMCFMCIYIKLEIGTLLSKRRTNFPHGLLRGYIIIDHSYVRVTILTLVLIQMNV